ncbi:MAG: cell division protein FtsQ [Bacteroidota bacterium]
MNGQLTATLKRLSLIGGLLLLAAFIISAAQHKRSRDARDVQIVVENLPNGRSLISKEDILLTLERSFGHTLAGIPVGELDVGRVERVLEADPFIFSADVYVDAENQVHIGIQQRQPVLRVIDRNGLNYYLDEFGEKLPLSKHFTARVLVANGNIAPHVPDFQTRKRKHILKDLFLLSKRIRQDEFLQPLVEQLHVNKKNEIILTPKIGKQQIELGSLDDLEDKIFRLKTFYKEGMPYAGWNKYKNINLKFKGQIVCKKG